jgi:hypothetical protein
MTGKITAIVAAAAVLASAGVASAQTNRHLQRAGAQWHAPYAGYYNGNSYYNQDYWRGTYDFVPGVGPNRSDPYAGTVFEGVAPY